MNSLKKIGLALILILSSPLLSQDEHITVHLNTQSSLKPIKIDTFESSKSNFSKEYLEELRNIFIFDFNYNGYTQVVKNVKKNTDQYELFVDINKDQLIVKLQQGLNQKKVGPLTLIGNLNSDRRQIHKISDALYKSITGQDGIAVSKILYTTTTKSKDSHNKSKTISEVWECDWDGGNARQVTFDNTLLVTPCYMPPKKGFLPGTFFYVSYRMGQPKIYVGSLKDGTSERLSSLRGNQLMPQANRQRNSVIFVSDVKGNPDLFIIDFDPETGAIGQPVPLYSSSNGSQGSPCFSPDGKKIAFVSNKDGNPRIYALDLLKDENGYKNSIPKLITKRSKESTSPSWSQDGKKIAYSAMTNCVRQIWIYDFDSKEETQLTFGNFHKENPSWAPDSCHLVFNSCQNEEGGGELYIINLNQKEAVKISSGSGEKRFANWEPK